MTPQPKTEGENLTDEQLSSFEEYAKLDTQSQWADYTFRLIAEVRDSRFRLAQAEKEMEEWKEVANKALTKFEEAIALTKANRRLVEEALAALTQEKKP